MKASLSDTLRVVLPALSPALAGPDARERLVATGQALPPGAFGGFECRLGEDQQQVDLLQGFRPAVGETALLAGHLAAERGPEGLAASGIQSLIDQDRAGVEAYWLEFDLDDPARAAAAPLLFIQYVPGQIDSMERFDMAEGLLMLIPGEAIRQPVRRSVRACFEACTGSASVSHIGLMLRAGSAFVRVNVAQLERDQLLPYLEAVGWTGAAGAVGELAARLHELAEAVTLCLDVAERTGPRLGFECAFARQPDYEPRWRQLLDDLVGRGLCSPEKREGFLAWRGYSCPPESTAPWPGHLIAEALARAEDEFGAVERRLSHIKISAQPDGQEQAKGYLGFRPAWLKRQANGP